MRPYVYNKRRQKLLREIGKVATSRQEIYLKYIEAGETVSNSAALYAAMYKYNIPCPKLKHGGDRKSETIV